MSNLFNTRWLLEKNIEEAFSLNDSVNVGSDTIKGNLHARLTSFASTLPAMLTLDNVLKYDTTPHDISINLTTMPYGTMDIPTKYTVVRGDNLTKISKKYAVTIADIQKWNGLTGDLIKIGQVLKIQKNIPSPEGFVLLKFREAPETLFHNGILSQLAGFDVSNLSNVPNFTNASNQIGIGATANSGGDYLTVVDWTNNGIGGFGSGMNQFGGTFRMQNSKRFSPKFYGVSKVTGRGWGGGGRGIIKTFSAANWGKGIGYGSLGISFVIGGISVTNAWQKDGQAYGDNTRLAVAQSSLGITGAWAGAEIGAAIGVWFGGVGAVPGAIIGGVVGGVLGGWGGSELGETIVTHF